MKQKSEDGQVVHINTDMMEAPLDGGSLFETRHIAYQNCNDPSLPKITIAVTAYNRLEKTKRCISYILEYTSGFDYELVLIDNGSTDGTFEYLQSVPYEKKTIWKVSKNIGLNYVRALLLRDFKTEYMIWITNDTYVTKNWLRNMMQCFQSDIRIGMVCPVSSNISNFQEVDLRVKDFADMQKKAARFNQPDPRKWQERMRIIDIILAVKREVCDSAGILDLGFYHDFCDDDTSVRIRHAGYKLMLCGDTYVYHDHDFRNMEDKDPEQFQRSLEAGRNAYREKYQGIDAWDDINNFELPMMQLLEQETAYPSKPEVLCVDPRCGTPVLQVRNMLRAKEIMDCISSAFTTKAKYFYDLQLATEGRAVCDRIAFFPEHYREESFDIVLLCEPVNTYPEPIRVTENLMRSVRKGGKLLVKLRNTDSAQALLNLLGIQQSADGDMPLQISEADFIQCLHLMGAKRIQQVNCVQSIPQSTVDTLVKGLRASKLCADPVQAVQRMNVWEFVFLIEK